MELDLSLLSDRGCRECRGNVDGCVTRTAPRRQDTVIVAGRADTTSSSGDDRAPTRPPSKPDMRIPIQRSAQPACCHRKCLPVARLERLWQVRGQVSDNSLKGASQCSGLRIDLTNTPARQAEGGTWRRWRRRFNDFSAAGTRGAFDIGALNHRRPMRQPQTQTLGT